MIAEGLNFIFSTLIFPGLLFAAVVSLLYIGFDRKVGARMQNRIGPPITQEFYDFGKLMTKEDITPKASQPFIFNVAPLFALGSVVTVMLLLPVNAVQPALVATADLIVIIYLLNIPAISMMVGGYSSGSPFGSTGAGRYVVQLFGYELVFILAILAVVARAGSLGLANVTAYQAQNGWLIFDFRLLPALIAIIIGAQGKLLRTPFDIPEAHTEIVAGPLTEYSGPKLALWRLSYNIETIAVLGLVAALFLGGPVSYVVGGFQIPGIVDFLIKTLLLVFLTTVIRSVMARLRIDQALKFFWTFGTLMGVISLILVLAVP